MGKLIHVVGTDTGVGKTAVAAALARGLRERGLDVGVCKPFASGEEPSQVPADAVVLIQASGATDDLALISPVRFEIPAAPWFAARVEGRPCGVEVAEDAVRALEAVHDVLIVEGIGGVAVPLDSGITYLDFLSRLTGALLIVARAGLGTLNHTLLTIEALRRRRIDITGVVLNRTGTESDPSEVGNPQGIEVFGGTDVLASLPHVEDEPERMVIPDPVYAKLSF